MGFPTKEIQRDKSYSVEKTDQEWKKDFQNVLSGAQKSSH